jgi:hypothetical protein
VKRALSVIAGLVIFSAGVTMAQTRPLPWPHFGVGITTDFFNNEPLQSMYQNIRVEVSPVIQLGSNPNTYVLPQIDYATGDGLVRIGGNVFVEVLKSGSWEFYTGGGMSLPQFATTDVVKFNSQASLAVDLGATRKIWTWTGIDGNPKAIRLAIALRQEFSGQIGEKTPEIISPPRITTLKIGIIF